MASTGKPTLRGILFARYGKVPTVPRIDATAPHSGGSGCISWNLPMLIVPDHHASFSAVSNTILKLLTLFLLQAEFPYKLDWAFYEYHRAQKPAYLAARYEQCRRPSPACQQNGRNWRSLQRSEGTSQATEGEEVGSKIESPSSATPLLGLDRSWGRLSLRQESIIIQGISSDKGKNWIDSSDWHWDN